MKNLATILPLKSTLSGKFQRFNTIDVSDCNWTRTQNHLVRKRTLNHLAKLTK